MPPNPNSAVLIGVEQGADGALKGPDYASADIRAMKQVLEGLGFSRKNLLVLAGKGTTGQAVEARLRTFLERASSSPPGSFLFYFAGPGFSSDGDNRLAFRDTSADDLEGTSIGLDWLIGEIREAPFTSAQIYLDCGWHDSLDRVPGISPLSEESLERSLEGAQTIAVFSSCRFHEASYSSPRLRRGIWSHHLVEAISGQVPEALTEGRYLTAQALQSHLDEWVPRTLRDTYTDRRKKQSPWMVRGPVEDMRIADIRPVLGSSKGPLASLAAVVKDFSFTRLERVRVKTLSGFRQGIHRSPKWSSRQAEEFVARIALGEIEADLSARFAEIRQNLAYRRRQIEVCPPGEGDASIRTPDFQYTVSVGLDEDPAFVVITRELSDFQRPEMLGDERLSQTFDGAFDAIRLTFDRAIELEDLIDLAEAHHLPVTYPPDCSSCTIRAADGGVIRVTGTDLALKYPGAQTLERLTRGLDQVLHLFPKGDALPAPTTRRR